MIEDSSLCYSVKGSPGAQLQSDDTSGWPRWPSRFRPGASQAGTCLVSLLQRARSCPSTLGHILPLFLFLIPSPRAAGRVMTLRAHAFLSAWTWRTRTVGIVMLEASVKMEHLLAQPPWKTVWRFPTRLKIELLYDPVVPLLGIFTEEMRSQSR